MNDEQVERLILKEIRRRGITYYDMTSMSNRGVDSTPEAGMRGRCNESDPTNSRRILEVRG
jgi:hypothetical protein